MGRITVEVCEVRVNNRFLLVQMPEGQESAKNEG